MLLHSSGRISGSGRATGPVRSISRARGPGRARSSASPLPSGPAAETVDPFATKEEYHDNFFDRFMIDVRHAGTLSRTQLVTLTRRIAMLPPVSVL